MPAFPALLVGGGLLILAALIMIYRASATPGRITAMLILSIVTSGASLLYETNRHSGMGTLFSRGYPKPFHFRWEPFEKNVQPRSDVNFLYLGVNTFVHLGVMSLIGAMVLRPHRRAEHHTMQGRMVVFRLMLGIMFLILGVIGGFIPILQGWIFILLGLLVLFPRAKFTEKVLHKAGPKLPRTVAFLRRFGIGSHE